MIPERAGITVDSTVQGEDIAMSIAADAAQHFMHMFTNMYEDNILAVIREYSTNARDSHIQAGQSRPIEVNTPTSLRPLLTIRDYGVGLDPGDIKSIYSQYGASTKRDSNDAVGMLGIGCKSALALVDQFTLVGCKDGYRMQVSIARDENGAGTMTVLDSGPTDEPNGVEVCIPTDAEYEMEHKAKDFFSYWEPDTVLLNGAPPDELNGYIVGDYTVAERDSNSYTNVYERHSHLPLTVVMGNVSYPVPTDYKNPAVDALPKDKRLVVRVPIGRVNFTPSRESLQDSERTRNALDTVLADFQSQVSAAVVAAVAGAPTRPTAARALIEARAAFGPKNLPELTWHGDDIPVALSAEDLPPVVTDAYPGGPKKEYGAALWIAKIAHGYRGGESYRAPAGQVSLDNAGKHPWILNYTNQKWSLTQRRKLTRYLEHHELHDEPAKATVYITDGASVALPEWIEGAVLTISWPDIKAWKDPDKVRPSVPGVSVKYAGTYSTYRPGISFHDETFPAADLPTSGRNLYYTVGDKYDAFGVRPLLGDKAYLVCLTEAREAKFLRLFPHAREAREVATRAARGWYKSLGAAAKLAIKIGPEVGYRYVGAMALPAGKINDPELSNLCRAYKLWKSGTLQEKHDQRVMFLRGAYDEIDIDYNEICARYPLIDGELDSTIENNAEHAILYVNAVYAANGGSK